MYMHILIYPYASYICTNILYIIQLAPLSMGFAKQEYWSGLPLPSPIQIDTSSFKIFVSGRL